MADRNTTAIGAGLTLVAAAFLLFARLGHYALWDDEAITALHAQGIWRTGDTSAVLDHNIVAYRSGATLRGFCERYTPPLPFYLAAPAVGLLGPTAWAARLPFALCGFACLALMLRWLARSGAEGLVWPLATMAIVGNVSMFLYLRQCRYYALTMLATVALGYVYVFRDGRRRTVVGFVLASLVLFASNYIQYAAAYAALAVDYACWGRHRLRLNRAAWLAVLIPQAVVTLPVFWVWNPLLLNVVDSRPFDWWAAKRTLLWWNVRDLFECEFACAALVLAAPWVYAWTRQTWLLRALTALAVCVVVVTFASPQPVMPNGRADVRYLAAFIPLGIGLGVLVLREVGRARSWRLAMILGAIAFGTNLFQGTLLNGQAPRSTFLAYLGELRHPPGEAFTPTAQWLKTHLPARKSVWVMPEHMTYPLMFHEPGPTYAWQFKPPGPAGLDPIHIRGTVAPDYIVAFGPYAGDLPRMLKRSGCDLHYTRVATVDAFWADQYRPELFWRRFEPRTRYDPDCEAVAIFSADTVP